jgi:hypothetical protein
MSLITIRIEAFEHKGLNADGASCARSAYLLLRDPQSPTQQVGRPLRGLGLHIDTQLRSIA